MGKLEVGYYVGAFPCAFCLQICSLKGLCFFTKGERVFSKTATRYRFFLTFSLKGFEGEEKVVPAGHKEKEGGLLQKSPLLFLYALCLQPILFPTAPLG